MLRSRNDPPTQDYKGQVFNENLYQLLVLIIGVRYVALLSPLVKVLCHVACLLTGPSARLAQLAGFAYGFATEDFNATFNGWLVAVVVGLVVCVPDWPVFNRDPVHWIGKSTLATKALESSEISTDRSDHMKTAAQLRAKQALRARTKR